ncbi:MAG: caspase family protein [Pirellulales bacterium]|nr:caspase family protein [Pirellulales bacterium]
MIHRMVGIFLAVLSTAFSTSLIADEATQRDIVRTKLTVEEEPWLRINAGGHTATVQALAFAPDSERLCSAGLDKDVLVWNLSTLRDIKRTFLRERTIRWQVARGLRGGIYALASAPNDGLLAIGGYGAMGSLGEILLVDPVKGTMVKVLEGHRQTVCSLAFSPDGKRLVSADTSGCVLLWDREGGKPVTIYEPDEKTYGPEIAALIAQQPKTRPVCFVGNNQIVVPVFTRIFHDRSLWWDLMLIDVNNPQNHRTSGSPQKGGVSALAASPDGAWLASAHLDGSQLIWDGKDWTFNSATRFRSPVISLSFHPDGRTLLVGTAIDGKNAKSQLIIRDIGESKTIATRDLPDHVHACAFSPDGKRFAYVGGKNNEVFVENFADLQQDNPAAQAEKPVALRGTGQKILKVAFAAKEPFYRVAFGTEFQDRGFNNSADLQETFDTAKLALGPEQKPDPADWLPSEWLAGGWTAKPQADGTLQLFVNGAPQGTVALKSQLPHLDEGRIRCYCWIPNAAGKPFAIAVGTDRQNSIYVCKLADRGPCPILRHFRGHNDYLTSLGVSRDLKYLVSGAADGTIRFWSLAELTRGREPLGYWGADFAVEGGKLLAKKVHPAGPLFHKGVRDGDAIKEIRWPADGDDKAIVDKALDNPAEMLSALRDMPWGTQVVFAPDRGGKDRPAFQILPAWQPLATLFVAANREWAFWTPAGYYDASMNGHRMFGWQVNRGLERLPDFYRADQFFKKLERPDLMERLLAAGSLQGAFQLAAGMPPAQLNESLPQQIAATPRVEILAPAPGSTIKDASTRVRAKIEVPPDRKVLHSKVFANGVVGKNQQLISERALPSGTEMTYEWDVSLPQDRKNLIQVMVGTDAPTAAFGDVLVDHQAAPETQPPKLFIVAMGIDKYGDPEIRPLAFSVADARAVAESLGKNSQGLYTLDDVALLTDKKVTPAEFRAALTELGAKLKTVARPNDLLLLFLAGHGIVDEETKKYYFVGHDFKMSDFEKGKYEDCISWDDFRELADVPCRKLALLDTCHSGAIQPPRSGDLKAAVRQLQEDVVFTVTASTGEQRSAEKPSWGHGAFTKCLLEALGGRADTAGSGYVTLDELVAYLKQSVPKITEGLQTPTAAPDDILPFTALPLTKVRKN